MISIINAGLSVVQEIVQLVRQGFNEEQIRERLADPKGVGKKLYDAIRARRLAIEEYKKHG